MTPEEIEILTCADPAPEQTAGQYMQEIYERRRANFAGLYAAYGIYNHHQMGRIISMRHETAGEFARGNVQINERRARAIEYAFRIPFGELDKEPPITPTVTVKTLVHEALAAGEIIRPCMFARKHGVGDRAVTAALMPLSHAGLIVRAGSNLQTGWKAVDPSKIIVVSKPAQKRAKQMRVADRPVPPVDPLYAAFGIGMADIDLPKWGKRETREEA